MVKGVGVESMQAKVNIEHSFYEGSNLNMRCVILIGETVLSYRQRSTIREDP